MKQEKKTRKKRVTKKPEKTEEQLVREYADRVIKGKASRGHVDERFDYTRPKSTVNKDMWLDADFYCCLVFQSAEQKNEFLLFIEEKFGVRFENFEDYEVNILNGPRLSAAMGKPLKPEKTLDYPYGPLDLRPFVLDDEKI